MSDVRIAVLSLAALVTGLIGGCAPMSTYPPVETAAATAITRPTFEPVPSVMTAALEYAQANYAQERDLAINLPEGAPVELYDIVLERLGGGRPMRVPEEPAIHVTQVRTRAFNAQVDLLYPRVDGINQTVTLTLRYNLPDGWRVTDAREWRIRHVAAPAPSYVEPASDESQDQSEAVAEATPASGDE